MTVISLKMISRTQTENFIRLRCGKMWHLNEHYPYYYKTYDGTKPNLVYWAVHTEIKLRKMCGKYTIN